MKNAAEEMAWQDIQSAQLLDAEQMKSIWGGYPNAAPDYLTDPLGSQGLFAFDDEPHLSDL